MGNAQLVNSFLTTTLLEQSCILPFLIDLQNKLKLAFPPCKKAWQKIVDGSKFTRFLPS